MIQKVAADADFRVLVLAPTALDAAMTQSILGEAGLRSEAHSSFHTLVESLNGRTAGALLLTEISVANHGTDGLGSALRSQPTWSDIPVVLLAGGGTDSPTAIATMEALGNVTVLERPAHVVTLISTLRAAIRARRRQYELRDRMLALETAEATVRSSERQFRRLVETAQEGIWEVDTEGRTVYVNQRLCDMLGETVDALMTRPVHAFFHPDEVHRVQERVKNRANSSGDTNEWRLRRSDGSYICVLSSATPVRDGNGLLVGAFAMMTDISDRKATEEALRESTRRKDEFIAVLAHELRNPLAPIRSSLQLLRFDDGAVKTAPVLDMLDRQVTHMVHLVDDLLEISRISSGVIELQRSSVSLRSVVHTAVEASTPHMHASGHVLDVQLPLDPLIVNVDAVRMAQVLTNLLNNAAKFSARGSRITLSASVGEHGDFLSLSVSDTGIGIAAEHLEKVFEMFSQVDKSAGRAQRGLGIGLALVRNLVTLHGGTVEARSGGRGKGSEFVIRLPVESGPRTPSEVARAKPDNVAHSLARFRMLVVDDNTDAANSISALLRSAGADVDTAYDGENALRLWTRHHHSTVLLDVGMPGMDGCQLARHIRSHPQGSQTMLIALTGWGLQDDRTRTREAGINHHLVKPVEFDVLCRLLTTS